MVNILNKKLHRPVPRLKLIHERQYGFLKKQVTVAYRSFVNHLCGANPSNFKTNPASSTLTIKKSGMLHDMVFISTPNLFTLMQTDYFATEKTESPSYVIFCLK